MLYGREVTMAGGAGDVASAAVTDLWRLMRKEF
jgi:hypothetical protein